MAARQSTSSNAAGDGPDNGGNIRVVVRVRPENKQEEDSQHRVIIKTLDENVLVFDPKQEDSPGFFHGKRRRGRDIMRRKNKDIRFAFDYVFDMDSSNRYVYENTTQGILAGLMDGYNCSVFAYGATGAGKTFTMLGSKENPGVVFHTMMELYEKINDLKSEKSCDVAISYLEVYNEQIRDLLNEGGFLPLREDPQRGVIVTGLSLHKPHSAEELLHMLEFGNKNRTQHPTDANSESSRSHAVFQVFVRQQDRTANISADVRVAKMSLIDLAGSERATVTKNRGARFREGANINRSLLALGNCINALADAKYKGYIPYRNSKLTRLLKDSLGGNCRTVMIAAVSPSSASLEDTHNTLKYANRAKNIKATLKRNVVSVDFHVSRYAKIVEELRAEVLELKGKLQCYEAVPPPVAQPAVPALTEAPAVTYQLDENSKRVRDEMVGVFSERQSIQKEMLELEGSERDLAYKIYRKQKAMARIEAIAPDPTKALSRLERSIASHSKRRSVILSRKLAVQERLKHNQEKLQQTESEIPQPPPQELLTAVHCEHLGMEVKNNRRQLKCLRKLVRAQHRDAEHSNKLVNVLLAAYKRQYYLLKGSGIATSDIHADFENIQNLAGGEAEVAWADETSSVGGDEQVDATEQESTSLDIDHLVTFPSFASSSVIGGSPMHPRTPKTPASCIKTRYGATPTTSRHVPMQAQQPKTSNPVQQSTHSTSAQQPHRGQSAPDGIPGRTVSGGAPTQRSCPAPVTPRPTVTPTAMEESPKLDATVTIPASQSVLLAGSLHQPATSSSTTVLRSPSPQDATFVINPTIATTAQSHNSQATRVNGPSNTYNVPLVDKSDDSTPGYPIQSGTITKSKPTVLTTNAVHTNSSTVTKSSAGTQEPLHHVAAKRSINFDIENQPSPAGKLTFAEAVKSPMSAVPRGLSQQNAPVRSPLASRENLPPHDGPLARQLFSKPHTSAHDSKVTPGAQKRRHRSPRHQHSPRETAPPHKHKRIASANPAASDIRAGLHRMGLPSLADRAHHHQQQPNYMKMTNAAANRQRSGLSRNPSFDQHDRLQASRLRHPTPPDAGNNASRQNARPAMQRSRSQSAMTHTRRPMQSTFF